MKTSFHLTESVGPVDHVLGPDHAPVTLVEYGDFECPHCKQAAGTVKLLLARHEQQVRFAFRNYPLEGIHPHAQYAAQAAECAAAQGRFWPMHDLLFANQQHLDPAHIAGYARTLGLDMARFQAEMDDEIYLQRVREHQRSGDASGVRATPTFYANGRLVDVSYGLQGLMEAVDSLIAAPPPDRGTHRNPGLPSRRDE